MSRAILARVESDVLVERPPLAEPADGETPRRSLRGEVSRRWCGGGVLLAIALIAAWLLVAPDSPDLAAQVYRARLFEEVGFAVWDNNWYGGHHLPGYSLVYPWLAALLGVRLVGAFAALVSTWAFERVALSVYGPRARWGALCFAVAAAGDLWIGRLTFAIGVAFALLAVLAVVRGRGWLAVLLALVCAASSPVAGLLLAFAGATHVLCERRLRPGVLLALAPFAVILPLQAMFPEGGWEPFAASSVLATLAVAGAFVWALPREEALLRRAGLVYVVATLLALIPAPMGSNVQRYAVLLAGPLLLCGLARSGWSSPRRPLALVVMALCGIFVWTVWGPVRQTAQVLGDPSTHASFYAPLQRFLATRGREPVRVEVAFTRSHWDAALLAGDVVLARGWERQLDKRYDVAIEADPLPPEVYRDWLRRNAVSYVALPDVQLDDSSLGEAALLRKGAPYLREVLRKANWRVFAVLDPTPLASAPAKMLSLGHDAFSLRFWAPGTSLVRVRYTPYWRARVSSMEGTAGVCVREGAEGWTDVSAARAGVVSVAARFSLASALGLGGACG